MPERPPPPLDMTDLDSISEEELNARMVHFWRDRRPLYNLYSEAMMMDNAPDFWKRFRLGSIATRTDPDPRVGVVLLAVENIHTYTMLGWETGIRNESDNLRRNGCTRAQLMELVMFTQLYGGMRGLGHTYHAIGDLLPVWGDPPALPSDYDELVWPEGWAADPEAFKCGLDMSTTALTDADRQNLAAWYERTIGYLPNSIQFGLKHNPDWVKASRAKWEVAIKTLPKQVVPVMLLRHNTVTGNREGLREAVLLGQAWGMTNELIVRTILVTVTYFTGSEGLYQVQDAIDDLL